MMVGVHGAENVRTLLRIALVALPVSGWVLAFMAHDTADKNLPSGHLLGNVPGIRSRRQPADGAGGEPGPRYVAVPEQWLRGYTSDFAAQSVAILDVADETS